MRIFDEGDCSRGEAMATTLFKDANSPLSKLMEEIDSGEIGLPDIQRPFVWTAAKVRDLFDSMYRGFPVGHLLFWASLRDGGDRRIGIDGKQQAPRLLIVDGQQRLTSLYTVLKGKPVLTADYREERIKIAFRPSDGHFEVANATTERDPEYIPDISTLWGDNRARKRVVRQFLSRLGGYRTLSLEEQDQLEEAIDGVFDLQSYPFKVIELSASAPEEDVADVFVRINSKGIPLIQSDFILTLMSVFWDKGRAQLEDFSRKAKLPTPGEPSPFNYLIEPDPDQLLRVAVGVGFRRGRLQYVYSLLRGKDLETGEFSEARRVDQFERLRVAQETVLDLSNWHAFLRCLARAGYRSKQMITSQAAVLYAYAFWLIGRHEFKVEPQRLQDVIARWFFMVHTTRRYSSSPESTFEADLARLRDLASADRFCRLLDDMVADNFTPDYWRVRLPNELDTSVPRSPTLAAYHAALILLDARALFSTRKVSELFDPVLRAEGRPSIRHPLFAKDHLRTRGITSTTMVNKIANLAIMDRSGNAGPGARSPHEHWAHYAATTEPHLLEQMQRWHALPPGWESMEFTEFLAARRRLMAGLVKYGFEQLRAPESVDLLPLSTRELIAAGESDRVEFKATALRDLHTNEQNRTNMQKVLRAIAGFANANGGTLLIGVDNDGTPVGVNDDYQFVSRGNRDGFELLLRSLVHDRISKLAATVFDIRFDNFDDKDICRIDVRPSPSPLFCRSTKNPDLLDFWVRLGGSTRPLTGPDLLAYQRERWP
jgi:hypothetical protein